MFASSTNFVCACRHFSILSLRHSKGSTVSLGAPRRNRLVLRRHGEGAQVEVEVRDGGSRVSPVHISILF